MAVIRYSAPTSRGTEEVLAAELSTLGLREVRTGRGVVHFEGTLAHGYRACLWSRVVSRVLVELATFEAPDADALYEGVAEVPWEFHVPPKATIAVTAVGGSESLRHSGFVARRVKDAVVDRLRARRGFRPDVNLQDPDLRLHLYLDGDHATLSVDLAGAPLHERGAGRQAGEAPLKETLAAAVLHLAGWPAAAATGAPLLDPFCGSGTLLCEAAAMALDRAPGLGRSRWGFEGWGGHESRTWQKEMSEARERARAGEGRRLAVSGFDLDEAVLRAARANVATLGLEGRLPVKRRALVHADPESLPPGLLVTNPPYGARLGNEHDLLALYRTLGDVLRHRFLGWGAWILTGSPALAKAIGLRPARRLVLFNGPIECRLLSIPISAEPPTRKTGPGWRKDG